MSNETNVRVGIEQLIAENTMALRALTEALKGAKVPSPKTERGAAQVAAAGTQDSPAPTSTTSPSEAQPLVYTDIQKPFQAGLGKLGKDWALKLLADFGVAGKKLDAIPQDQWPAVLARITADIG